MAKSEARSPKKILIVEDDPEILNIMDLLLGLEGYDVGTFANGDQIMKSEASVPDLYIIDKVLPNSDGLDICQFIRSHPTTSHIPVIVISATQARKEAYEVGANLFIEKPFLMHAFLQHVANTLDISPKNKWFGL
jgi:DNA-binding response OmpR family regulator